jgi:hypothetical protein
MAAWIVAWFLPFAAPADIVLNWDALTWTPGSLSQSYDIDPNNPGNDITITFSGDTSYLHDKSPAIDAATRGGQSPAQDSLGVHVDFANNSQKLTVTITFNYAYGVDAASFRACT